MAAAPAEPRPVAARPAARALSRADAAEQDTAGRRRLGSASSPPAERQEPRQERWPRRHFNEPPLADPESHRDSERGGAGYADQPARPEAGVYSQDMQEFILPYAAVQSSATPEADLLSVFESTYEAAANCADWDREALEWNGQEKL